MPQALRQSQTNVGNPDDWLPLAEAASLLGHPLRSIRWRARAHWHPAGLAELRTPRSGRGKPTWFVHRSVDSRFRRCVDKPTREDRARQSLLARFPAHHVAAAYRKAHWLSEWRKRCATPRIAEQTDLSIAAQVVAEAKEVEGDGYRISVRTLQGWHAAYNAPGDDGHIAGVGALVDRYVDNCDDSGGRSPEAVAYFRELYRTELKLSVAQCHGMVRRKAKTEGWQWARTARATSAWLKRYDDVSLSFLCRNGKRAWTHRFMRYLEQDWEAVAVGEFYVGDHAQCDFWVTHKGKQIRPWMTAIQDCRSRRIVGWRLGPAPHQEAIICALRMAFREAIPTHYRIDNGKDFTAKAFTGLTKAECRRLRSEFGSEWKDAVRRSRELIACDDPRWYGIAAELGVELIYAHPYHAWSKGTVERFFLTFHSQCAKTIATYCGNSPTSRPESVDLVRKGYTGRSTEGLELIDGSAVPTMEEAREHVAAFIEVYENTPHSGRGCDGATPMAVWKTAKHLSKASGDALDFLMSVRGTYKVGPNGVSLTVAGTRLSYGGTCSALRRWVGRKVLVAVDPEHPARCTVFDPASRRMIAALQPNQRLHPLATADDLREASAEVNRDRKGMHDFARKSARRTLTATARTNRDLHARADGYRATGTDDSKANIAPVRTGFEGVSTPVQSAGFSEAAMPEPDGVAELFMDEEPDRDDITMPLDVGDLLSDEDDRSERDDGLAAFFDDEDDKDT